MDLVNAIKASRPILYWRGRPGASGIWRDLSGHGNHSTSSGGTIGRAPCDLPGDPLTGWTADDSVARAMLGGAISGFNVNEGTILCFLKVRDFSGGGLRGLFDTAPSAVGAARLYTTDDFTTMHYEIGGDSSASSSVPAEHQLSTDIRMIALHWRSGQTFWTLDGIVAGNPDNWGVAPAGTDFHWGSVNAASVRGGTAMHSVVIWPRNLTNAEIKTFRSLAYARPSRVLAAAVVAPALPYWGVRVG